MTAFLHTPNPAYVRHPTIASSRRIHVDGFDESDYEIAIALLQFQNGKVGMVVDGLDATFEHLIKAHQLMTEVTKEMDRRLQLHAQTVPGEA